MSEVAANGGEGMAATASETVGEAAEQAQASAGWLLRQAREAAGIDLAALAVALKVSMKKLEALESDRLDLLPDAVFVRALASSICRALKIDAAPVLARLPQTVAPRLQYDDETGLNTPFHTPGDVAKTPFWDRLSRPTVLAALAVLMGALVLIFFPSSEQRAEIGAIVARPAAPAAPAEPAEPEPALVPSVPAAPAPVAAPAQLKAPAATPPVAKIATPPAAKVAPVAPVPQPAPAVPAATLARTAAAAPAAAASSPVANGAETPVRKKLPSTGIVVFKTSGPSWVEVTDGKGAIQLSRMVEPGEPVGASGPLPLSVTIGRADVTEVQVRGQPFPLEPVTKQGVARFEVK